MKMRPLDVVPYQKTSEFTEGSMPSRLFRAHQTKAAVWAKIVVLEENLTDRILELVVEELVLDSGRYGVVEPTIKHAVLPHGGVRFYVEFYRQASPELLT